jgi:hypothetical protein
MMLPPLHQMHPVSARQIVICWPLQGLNSLESITFENDLRLTRIEDSCFQCCSLSEISIPTTVDSIGQNAFDDDVTVITFSSGLIAEDGRSGLRSVVGGMIGIVSPNIGPDELNRRLSALSRQDTQRNLAASSSQPVSGMVHRNRSAFLKMWKSFPKTVFLIRNWNRSHSGVNRNWRESRTRI